MKKIAIVALKGGVGKSSVVAGLGLALAENFKVGLVDVDITGSNLYSALGLPHSPKWDLDTPNEKVVVPEVNGYWLLSIASHVGEDYAVLWESTQHQDLERVKERLNEDADIVSLKREIDNILAASKWRFVSELLSEDIVTWPEPVDYLVVDTPPSTSAELYSLLDIMTDLFGVIIVSQPAKISSIGLMRTIDLLKQRQIPIIGLVANQDGFLNRYGEIEYQFLSPRVNLEQVALEANIPFLVSIPQTGDSDKLKPYFSELAEKVISSKPVVLKEVTTIRKLKRKVAKGIARRL